MSGKSPFGLGVVRARSSDDWLPSELAIPRDGRRLCAAFDALRGYFPPLSVEGWFNSGTF